MAGSAISRADLIRCSDRMEPERFLRVAESLGYREKPRTEPAPDKSGGATARAGGVSGAENTTLPVAGPRHRQYRLVERHALAPPEILPEPDVMPVEEEPVPPLGSPPPLVPWPRLWPFLRAALGATAERGRVDLPDLVARLSRGKPLRRLPRLRCRRWAGQGQLILDLHHRLYPFWDDFNALKAALPKLRGKAGLEILRLDQGPDGLVQRWETGHWRHGLDASPSPCGRGDGVRVRGSDTRDEAVEGLDASALTLPSPGGRGFPVSTTAGHWGEPRPYVPPPAGTPVLIAGDIGCLGSAEDRRAWVRFGRRLAGLDVVPVVLTPCPPRGWDPALAGLYFPVVLDRTARFPPSPAGPRPWPAEAPQPGWIAAEKGAETLLTLLSACIGITPSLLRHLRHALPAERADVGGEAAAWLHPAFRAGDFALLPGDAEGIERLRSAFPLQDAAERQLAWELIRAQQQGATLAVRMEERALHAAMEGKTDAAVEEFLQRVAAALQQSQTADGDQARFLASWVNRRGRRMHAAAWHHSPRSEALWLLANPQARNSGTQLPAGLNLHRALAALEIPEHPQSWRLVQRGELFVVEHAEAAGDQDYIAGSPVVAFVTRRPVLQLSELCPGATDRSLSLAHGVSLPVTEDGYRILTDGDELVIEHLSRPPWAEVLGRDAIGLYASFRVGEVSQRLRWIGPGNFLMGSPDDEHDRYDDEHQHEVVLTRGFWLADTACTQALWQAVMGNNPSRFKGEKRPVDSVSWDDVQTFLTRLDQRVPGLAARLPTEAEWEYGCRAGTTTPFSFGEDITPQQVNYDGNHPYRGSRKGLYRGKTVEVAGLPVNPWGLYEMHGNVLEWCADWYGEYPPGTAVDPAGPETGGRRVLRGGSWFDRGRNLRSASRFLNDPGLRGVIIGFRLALGPELEPAEPQPGSGAGQAARAETGGSGRRGRSGTAGRSKGGQDS